jgi:hypothetical protein
VKPPVSGTLAIAVPRSHNSKLGAAATTYAAQGSCPTSCVFFNGGGCYAETGEVGKFVTKPLNDSEAIDAMELEPGLPLRLHTVGDCASDEAALVVAAAAERYVERGGGPVWTYTHGWRGVAREAWGAVSVLASCETAADVQLARERGYAPALVVEEFPSHKLYEVADGAGVLPCPAQTRHDVSCSDCRLCFDDAGIRERGYAIGFELHGIPFTVRAAKLALTDPDWEPRRQSSRTLIPELLAREPDLTHAELAQRLRMNESSVRQMRRRLAEEEAAA